MDSDKRKAKLFHKLYLSVQDVLAALDYFAEEVTIKEKVKWCNVLECHAELKETVAKIQEELKTCWWNAYKDSLDIYIVLV